MSNLSKGKYALFISDRSGLAFPYREMVREWNGARGHTSEFEPKQPQLDPKPYTADPQGLPHPRPARVEPATVDFLNDNPFTTIGRRWSFGRNHHCMVFRSRWGPTQTKKIVV